MSERGGGGRERVRKRGVERGSERERVRERERERGKENKQMYNTRKCYSIERGKSPTHTHTRYCT